MTDRPSLIIPPDAANEEAPKVVPRLPFNCTLCKHFDGKIPEVNGHCLRYPPTIHVIGMQQGRLAGQMMPVTQQFAPTVGPTFVCGEFQPRQQDLQ